MNTEVMFSKKTDDWSTPKELYNELNKEFNFTYDPCPLRSNEDGLQTDWIGNIFINPPYSNIKGFLEKGLQELEKGNAKTLVYLVPARTDTKWFHEYVYNKAEIKFIKGRLKFGDSKNSAPFPSMLVIFRKKPYKVFDFPDFFKIDLFIKENYCEEIEPIYFLIEEDGYYNIYLNKEYKTQTKELKAGDEFYITIKSNGTIEILYL